MRKVRVMNGNTAKISGIKRILILLLAATLLLHTITFDTKDIVFSQTNSDNPNEDNDFDGIPDDIEHDLLQMYSPYYKFSKGEDYRPTDAVWLITHGSLKRYEQETYNHACTVKRISDAIPLENIYVLGVRSAEKEEFNHAIDQSLSFYDIRTIWKKGIKSVSARYASRYFKQFSAPIISPDKSKARALKVFNSK